VARKLVARMLAVDCSQQSVVAAEELRPAAAVTS
jgi:hypothetical protein